MKAWEFVVLALAAYRLHRIVTKDDWPPSEWFRDRIESRFGVSSSWFTLVTCSWCFGLWTVAVVFAEHRYLHVVPFWVYALLAAATVVGLVGEWESRL